MIINVPRFLEIHGPWNFENSWSMNFLKFMVHQLFGIQCPTIFCDFGLFNSLAQAGGGGALLYDISLPKTYRPKLLTDDRLFPQANKNAIFFYFHISD